MEKLFIGDRQTGSLSQLNELVTIMPVWREDPYLKNRFHPTYPDDVQVLIHNGGPRMSDRTPELVWVRVLRQMPDHFEGVILNQPENLENLKQGDLIWFITSESSPHPLYVTQKYLDQRKQWTITPCDKCGFSELFDAPMELIDKVFPERPHNCTPEGFTTFCAYCGGVQIVFKSDLDDMEVEPDRKWWQFWK